MGDSVSGNMDDARWRTRWEEGACWCCCLRAEIKSGAVTRPVVCLCARACLSAAPRAITAAFACAGVRRRESSFGDCLEWRVAEVVVMGRCGRGFESIACTTLVKLVELLARGRPVPQ